ncbi:DNA-binding response regulator, OmpR family, contains REC and winged-helix (wHTH) domain [Modestobacter sp. DSM 44400]|uniref:response regulator transcription factor n=1 Tax=Modestobacter sp. DSM 44400 TaxID=1550230 RepID=UPI00089AB7BA|nr:response regulator transcription factor [Modestobacter sp. DSM 44400]SDY67615.1 DNA-binding response regulator, OmpR family, contains REC and winged-helix (wHTH) domain [Modestobacter sp. DSM 44400]
MGRVSPRLLLVEDDDHIRTPLRWALEDEGYEVAEAASGEDACRQVAAAVPDLMVVDLMLGAMDGFAVIREVRRAHDLPIVVVSARADTHDIVAALEAGADDYVTKPFQVKEITARLRALRRRAGAGGGPDERPQEVVLDHDMAGNLVLRPERGSVHRGDQQVHLTLTEFRLLCELAASTGRVLSRQALLERVWEHGFFGDERLVDVHVRRLRTKVERDPSAPRLVVTVRGLGYRLDPQ